MFLSRKTVTACFYSEFADLGERRRMDVLGRSSSNLGDETAAVRSVAFRRRRLPSTWRSSSPNQSASRHRRRRLALSPVSASLRHRLIHHRVLHQRLICSRIRLRNSDAYVPRPRRLNLYHFHTYEV